MTLAALIRKRESGKVANANPAKVANDGQERGESLARLAALALANPPEAKAEGVDLTALLTEACQGVPGIDAATFRALLSPEDIEDIEGGDITLVTLRAYAQSFAKGIRVGRIEALAAAAPKPRRPRVYAAPTATFRAGQRRGR